MACYNREILCPYLRDVFTAELLCAKIKQESTEYQDEISTLYQMINKNHQEPSIPNRADYHKDLYLSFGWIIVGAIITIIGYWIATSWKWFDFIGIIGGVFGALIVLAGILFLSSDIKNGDERYEEALSRYNEKIAEISKEKSMIPAMKETLAQYQQEYSVLQNRLQAATRLRDDVYNVNVIPKQYRNIKVASYLYEYFESCQECDLDRIIQTFLLDEIKQKLDRIIIQNEEILINQRMQIAADEERDRISTERHREEMRGIARMEQNQQTQIAQQKMIEKNQEVTNFFLAADYIRKYR
jgi:hypothetical protein